MREEEEDAEVGDDVPTSAVAETTHDDVDGSSHSRLGTSISSNDALHCIDDKVFDLLPSSTSEYAAVAPSRDVVAGNGDVMYDLLDNGGQRRGSTYAGDADPATVDVSAVLRKDETYNGLGGIEGRGCEMTIDAAVAAIVPVDDEMLLGSPGGDKGESATAIPTERNDIIPSPCSIQKPIA